MIAVQVNSRDFSTKMENVIRQARNPRAVMAGVGREAANQLRRHFREKDRTQVNQLAPDRREHFWLKVQQSVQAPVVDSSGKTVTISITHPAYAQKVFGGTIHAKRVRNLAIPVEGQAYGRSPAVFEQETGLKLFFLRQRGAGILAAVVGRGIQVEYILTPSVTQAPDPTALPPLDKLETALATRADKILDRQLNPGKS
jgi:hypothetical protein